MLTYHMDGGVLKFVLLLVVKNETVLLNEADHWSLPSGTFQERDQAIKDPVLQSSKDRKC